ncbi:hypothetical protein Pla123a_37560 [Posidoniimonas polymericola]|uniref:Uncharacterized protein n=1 Tax=Posidoniimonas polymericola TaxID=2528002 RepID=A0A5C5YG11_9BACT|nr:DUF6428 family protein [Posidoniimonas polymericola]TWT73421.1 hypothetical protein Pla123a_37560 [Posidoniimonas polymericola]
MNLTEFRQVLADHPRHGLRFVISDQAAIADHFHVTEVGRVEKRFVDCGGQPRQTVACVLQTLVAHDVDHRLTTDKLAGILKLVDSLDLPVDAPVEVEHQERSVSVDAVDGVEVANGVVEFSLAAKQTACLAEDACGLAPTPQGLNVIGGDCCGGSSGCC